MKRKEYIKNIKSKDIKNLYKTLSSEYNNLYKLRFSEKFRNLKDVRQIRKTKKNISRIYTILNDKLNKE